MSCAVNMTHVMLYVSNDATRTINVRNPGRMNREQCRQWMAAMKRGARKAALMAELTDAILGVLDEGKR